MTLQVRITNKGNNPGDTFIMKNVEIYPRDSEDDPIYCRAGGNDTLVLMPDQEAIFYPPCDHFDEFVPVLVKGKH